MQSIPLIQWTRQNDGPWNECVFVLAAKEGHVEVLKYLHENGCPWDERTCVNAAKGGHLQVLKWLRENGYPWNECAEASSCAEVASREWLPLE
jgi:hypothetical protein